MAKLFGSHTCMKLQINGEDREFSPSGASFPLSDLIEQLGMKADRVAIELNLEIVPREKWAATPLKSGDKLEIVHFVGGGHSRSNRLVI